MPLGPANYTLLGSTIADFVRVVTMLSARGWLWSSLCDRKGDWAVSTADDTDGDELVALLEASGIICDLYRYGEMRWHLEDVLDGADKELLSLDPEVEVG